MAAGSLFEGRAIGGIASHALARRGINRTFQSPKPFLSLTVLENVTVAATYGNAGPAPDLDALLASLELDTLGGPAGGGAEQRAAEDARSGARAGHRARACCWSTNWRPGSIRPNWGAWRTGCARWPGPAWRCWWSST